MVVRLFTNVPYKTTSTNHVLLLVRLFTNVPYKTTSTNHVLLVVRLFTNVPYKTTSTNHVLLVVRLFTNVPYKTTSTNHVLLVVRLFTNVPYKTTSTNHVLLVWSSAPPAFWKTLISFCHFLIWANAWQNQQKWCAPSKDINRPGYLPSLIRVFAVRMKKPWVLSYLLSAQRRLGSVWADAQVDLSLCWAHMSFCCFCPAAALLIFVCYLLYTGIFVCFIKFFFGSSGFLRTGTFLFCYFWSLPWWSFSLKLRPDHYKMKLFSTHFFTLTDSVHPSAYPYEPPHVKTNKMSVHPVWSVFTMRWMGS